MNKFCKISYGSKWRAYQKKAVGRDRLEELQIIDAREYFTEVRNAHKSMKTATGLQIIQSMNGWFKEVYGKSIDAILNPFVSDGVACLIESDAFTGNHK